MKKLASYTTLLAIIFLIDRVSKYCAYHYLENGYEVNSLLSFNLALNRGIIGGVFNTGATNTFLVMSALSMLVYTVFACFVVSRFFKNYIIIPEVLILAGGISNIVDRFVYHGVIDFIVVHWGSWSWPAFNCADASIVVGVLLLGVACIRE